MRVNDDYKEWNIAAQRADFGSVWHFWKAALAFRKAHPACVRIFARSTWAIRLTIEQIYGKFDLLDSDNEDVLAFTKTTLDEQLLVICNFTEEPQSFKLPLEMKLRSSAAVISNVKSATIEDGVALLQPFQAQIHVC
jgi:glycosidase